MYSATLWNVAPKYLLYQFLAIELVLPIRQAVSLPLHACMYVCSYSCIRVILILLQSI